MSDLEALAMPAPMADIGLDVTAIKAMAHEGYLKAINSNDADALMAVLRDDIVFQAPGLKELIGKDEVRRWVDQYLATYETYWEKESIGFTVSGDWAFERNLYRSKNIDRKTGVTTTDTGKGINIYHRDPDDQWRVAIDSWNSDGPASG